MCRIGPDGFYGSGWDWNHPLIGGATYHRPRRAFPVEDASAKPVATPPGSVDDQRIGALLDGRLDGEERVAALIDLAASEDDGMVFYDTAAVLRAVEGEEGRS